MSEKRLKFTLESDRQYIGIFDEGCALTGFEVCNFLNSLYQQCEALQDKNEQLRQELNGKDCRKCSNYCRDKALDYCLVDEREPYYFSFPFKWDYKAEAEKCKYYYR